MQRPWTAVLLLVIVGCGGAQASKAPPAVAWQDMDGVQRAVYMEDTVLPEMRTMFAAFDASYAEMDCATCHGAGAEATSYAMPNPDLWELPTEAGWAALTPDAEQTRWLEFMGGKVKPAMARLLGMSDYDWQTKQGDFNCGGCHPSATE